MFKKPFIWLTAIAALLLAACASLIGPRQVDVPLSTLQASIDRRFPLRNRFLEFFDINVSSPRVMLQPDSNRLVTVMDASIAPPFLKKSWNGSLTLSGVLDIDAARNAVVLREPRVDAMNIDGVDTAYSRQIAKVAGLLAEQLFVDLPLYTFNPADFRTAGVSFLPTKINAKANALVVTFEPVR